MIASQPKLAIIQFHELNKTAKVKDPYRNFENDTIVENDILMTVLFEKYKGNLFHFLVIMACIILYTWKKVREHQLFQIFFSLGFR